MGTLDGLYLSGSINRRVYHEGGGGGSKMDGYTWIEFFAKSR